MEALAKKFIHEVRSLNSAFDLAETICIDYLLENPLERVESNLMENPHIDARKECLHPDNCIICFNETSICYTFNCGSKICSACVRETMMQTVPVPLNLGCYICGERFPIRLWQDNMTPAIFEKSVYRSLRNSRKYPFRVSKCIGCDIVNVVNKCKNVHCKCGEIYCVECEHYHTPVTCDMVKIWEGISIKSQISANLVKPCPHCKTIVSKLDGCNYIVCDKCKGGICWRCGGKSIDHACENGCNIRDMSEQKEEESHMTEITKDEPFRYLKYDFYVQSAKKYKNDLIAKHNFTFMAWMLAFVNMKCLHEDGKLEVENIDWNFSPELYHLVETIFTELNEKYIMALDKNIKQIIKAYGDATTGFRNRYEL